MSLFIPSGSQLRACCPSCKSVSISRRTRKGGYVCSQCGAHFLVPAKKTQETKPETDNTTIKMKTRIVKLHSEAKELLQGELQHV